MNSPSTPSPARAAGAVFSVRGLSVFYGGKPALEGVDLDVSEGEITALIGPSGCGKTSFLSCLNRMTDLVPGCEVRGSIRFRGEELGGDTDVSRLRREIGMVFQRPNPFALSIERNLHLPLREHGVKRSQLGTRTREVLTRVGLWEEVKDRLGRSALELSGGQQQRLCIARALTLSPRVLLMDEPCSSLDPLASETVEELIGRLRGLVTVVIVTHNLAQARRLADDVALFWRRDGAGRVIETGKSQEFFQSPREVEAAAYLAGMSG